MNRPGAARFSTFGNDWELGMDLSAYEWSSCILVGECTICTNLQWSWGAVTLRYPEIQRSELACFLEALSGPRLRVG